MKKCSHCGMENSDNENYCVHCGYAMQAEQPFGFTGDAAPEDLFDSPFVVDNTKNGKENQQTYPSEPAPYVGNIFEENEPPVNNLFEQPLYPAQTGAQQLQHEPEEFFYSASQEFPQNEEDGLFRRAEYEEEAYPQEGVPQQDLYAGEWEKQGPGGYEQGAVQPPQPEYPAYPAGEAENASGQPYQSLLSQQPEYGVAPEPETLWQQGGTQSNAAVPEAYTEREQGQHVPYRASQRSVEENPEAEWQRQQPMPETLWQEDAVPPAPPVETYAGRDTQRQAAGHKAHHNLQNHPESGRREQPRQYQREQEIYEDTSQPYPPQQQYPSQPQRQAYREQQQAPPPRQAYREPARQQPYDAGGYGQGPLQEEYYEEGGRAPSPRAQRPQQPLSQRARSQGYEGDGYEEPRPMYRGNRPSREPRYNEAAVYEEPRKRGGPIKIIALVLAILLLAGGGFLATLYYLNSPGRTINNFISILEKRDASSLPGGAEGEEGAAKWEPLFNAFTDKSSKTELRNQLKQDTPAASAPYAAIQIKSEPVFLFIRRYYIDIHAVQALVPQAAQGSILVLDGKQYSGRLSDDGTGLLFSGILPGRYTAQLMAPGQDAAALPEGETVDLFATEAPNSIELIVNDPIDTGGDSNGGEPDDDISSSGSGPQDIAASVSIDQMNALLVSFYQSYLNSINNNDISLLRTATDTARAEVQRRMGLSGNKENNFEYVSAAVKSESVKASERNGVPVLTFNASFNYKYWPRDNSKPAESGSNYQTVEMIYENGEWKVNRFTIINKADFDANKLAAFS